MKTYFIWNSFDDGLKYYMAVGDGSRFDNQYINSVDISDEDTEEMGLMSEGATEFASLEDWVDAIRAETSRADYCVIECGFIP